MRHSQAGTKVLDMGGGDGAVAQPLVHSGREVFLTDIDRDALQRAEKRIGCALKVSYCNAEMPLEFQSEEFPVVAMIGLLGGISPDKTEGLLREVHRVLQPGGVLVCLVSRQHFPFSAIVLDRIATRWAWRHFHAYLLCSKLRSAGFQVEEQYQLGGWASVAFNYVEHLAASRFFRSRRARRQIRRVLAALLRTEAREFHPDRPQHGRYLYLVARKPVTAPA